MFVFLPNYVRCSLRLRDANINTSAPRAMADNRHRLACFMNIFRGVEVTGAYIVTFD